MYFLYSVSPLRKLQHLVLQFTSAFEKELSVYDRAKGTVRFPTEKPLPLELIRKIVRFRVEEDLKK